MATERGGTSDTPEAPVIRVTIELVSAITHKTTEIGRMYIANDGEGAKDRGNYNVAVCRRGTTVLPLDLDRNLFSKAPTATRKGRVENYPRLAYNVWRLITRACLSAFPEERAHCRGKVARDTAGDEVLLARIDELERENDRLATELERTSP